MRKKLKLTEKIKNNSVNLKSSAISVFMSTVTRRFPTSPLPQIMPSERFELMVIINNDS